MISKVCFLETGLRYLMFCNVIIIVIIIAGFQRSNFWYEVQRSMVATD